LYDTEKTRQLVVKIIEWYKKYRDILNSSIIHLRRADGRDWDGFIHVNPHLKQKGLVMLFNPTKEKIARKIKLPLYYTGLTTIAAVKEKDNVIRKYSLNRDYEIEVTVTIEPENYTWLVVE
jgi:hypothetical protein